MTSKGPELRIGLVLYGGVSLAVYIFGVVLEVQRLIRAARELEGEGDPGERSAYARALDRAGLSTVTVDIVSGTSAGGINGILLAKALARGTDIASVKDVWLDGGDIAQLLQPPSALEPRSLLASADFERKLSAGLEALDPAPGSHAGPRAPVLDLFVSSTSIRGGLRRFTDSLGETIESRKHRYVFQLKLRRLDQALGAGYEEDNFTAEDNERLVKLARATSAFPVAFEPVAIGPADELLERGERAAWFADGGILNNKPFSEAVETILARSSDRRVNRWLLSVDPDPKPLDEPGDVEPLFDEIAVRAIAAIPRYQSIVADLAALRVHNERVDAIDEAILALEADLAGPPDEEQPPGPLSDAGEAYRVLRRQAWGIEIADRLLAAVQEGPHSGFDPLAVHRGFRDAAEAAWAEAGSGPADLTFGRRRVYYLTKLLGLAERVEGLEPDALRTALWTEYEILSDALWRQLTAGGLAAESPEELPEEGWARIFRDGHLGTVGHESGNRLEARLAGVRLRLPARQGHPVVWVEALRVFGEFERRDALLLPAEIFGEGGRRDRVRHAQISPRASNTGVQEGRKLAGVSLHHFGGFLDKGWRANDLMWGRLDAAETLVRAIAGDGDPALLDGAQEEVLREELPAVLGEGGSWKQRLQEHVGDGPSFAQLDPRRFAATGLRAAAVVRRMLATAATALAEGGTANRIRGFALRRAADGLGFVLALLYLPATAFFGKGSLRSRVVVLAALLPTLWGLATLALGVIDSLGIVEIFDLSEVALPAALATAVYPLFLAGYWFFWLLVRRLKRLTG